MKKILLLIVFVPLSILWSCNNGNTSPKSIEGKWVITEESWTTDDDVQKHPYYENKDTKNKDYYIFKGGTMTEQYFFNDKYREAHYTYELYDNGLIKVHALLDYECSIIEYSKRRMVIESYMGGYVDEHLVLKKM